MICSYKSDELVAATKPTWSRINDNNDVIPAPEQQNAFSPGDAVSLKGILGGYGIVISHVGDEIIVLWSRQPRSMNFADFVMPISRPRYHYQQFAKQIISVQPMTMPSGNIFYLDYKYGASGSI